MQEMWVWSLGQNDPLEKEMTVHSSILAWEDPWTEAPGGLQCMGSQRVGHDWATKQQQQVTLGFIIHNVNLSQSRLISPEHCPEVNPPWSSLHLKNPTGFLMGPFFICYNLDCSTHAIYCCSLRDHCPFSPEQSVLQSIVSVLCPLS